MIREWLNCLIRFKTPRSQRREAAERIVANSYQGYQRINPDYDVAFRKIVKSLHELGRHTLPELPSKVETIFLESQSLRSDMFDVNGEKYICLDLNQVAMISQLLEGVFDRSIKHPEDLFFHFTSTGPKAFWGDRSENRSVIDEHIEKSGWADDLSEFRDILEQQKLCEAPLFSLALSFLYGHELGHVICETLDGDGALASMKWIICVGYKRSGPPLTPEERAALAQQVPSYAATRTIYGPQDDPNGAMIDEEIFCDALGGYFLGLAAKRLGLTDEAMTNTLFVLPSLILTMGIDGTLIHTFFRDQPSKFTTESVIARLRKRQRVSQYGSQGFSILSGSFLLPLLDGEPPKGMRKRPPDWKPSPGRLYSETPDVIADEERIDAIRRHFIGPESFKKFMTPLAVWDLYFKSIAYSEAHPFHAEIRRTFGSNF